MKYYSEFDLLNPANFRFVTEFDETGTGIGYKAIPIDIFKNIPTVDAVEVVRCRDCVYLTRSPWNRPDLGWCKLYGHNRKMDYYCASGEKKHEKKV